MNIEQYINLKLRIIAMGYADEIDYIDSLKPCDDVYEFMSQTIWVIVNSGMKEQIARKIYNRIIAAVNSEVDISDCFGHKGKVKAILDVIVNRQKYFDEYRMTNDKIAYLETLPFVGKITKYHLARNLGLDFCKPDRHLVRIAESFNTTPLAMCEYLSRETGDRIGVVDVVIWRAANLGLI